MAGPSVPPAAPHSRALPPNHGRIKADLRAARRPTEDSWQQALSIFTLATLLVASALVPPTQSASAETTLGSEITVGARPFSIALNPATNRLYVANVESNSVTVIDTTTDVAVGAPIQTTAPPSRIAVNSVTGRVYVTHETANSVTVIDGATNTVIGSPIRVGSQPTGVAVNTTTNRIYVVNTESETLSVIDGSTNTVIPTQISVEPNSLGIAVNSITNRVYVSSYNAREVLVVDGAANMPLLSIQTEETPYGLAVHPGTNRIYVAHTERNSLSVLDGVDNRVISAQISVGMAPMLLDVNPATNRIYVANSGSNAITVVNGANHAVIGSPIPVGLSPRGVAVHPATNRVYAANYNGGTVSVIGVPFGLGTATVNPGGTVAATWSSLFSPNGTDYVGLFTPQGTTPLSRIYTSGTASPGGSSVAAGTVALPIPGNLPAGRYEVRLVNGPSNGLLARADLTVALAPVAAADTHVVSAGRTLSVPAPGLLANDTDADSPTLKATVETRPTHGTLTVQETGAFTYTPAAGFTGADSFTYRATDQTGLESTATVTLTVVAVAAVADDSYTVNAGGALTVAAPGVLANDVDADSPSLQATVVTAPANGTLNLQPNGAFTYTPRPSFAGTDRFTYRASDETSQSATGTVIITVAPVACGPRPTANVSTSVANGALQVTVSVSDVDGPTHNRLKELRFGSPVNGRVELAGQSQTAAFTHTVPAPTDRISFAVRRVSPGQTTTVPLTVVDECGAWPTLVGGGTGAGF